MALTKLGLGFICKKAGMTRMFEESGKSVPVTVFEMLPHYITQIKTPEKHGYSALQVATGVVKASRLNKAEKGLYAKAEIGAQKMLREFRVAPETLSSHKVGEEYKVDLLNDIKMVDVAGISKGKGFAGAIKRHNFSSQRQSHGNSLSHRAPGSIGQCQDPGRVFKGKRMAGHMGNELVTVQNLQVMGIDLENNMLLIKGGVPGAIGSWVTITKAVKTKKTKKTKAA